MSDRDWAEVFTREFEQPESAVQARVWAEVLGDEYPVELAPYSYTTRSELDLIADAVAVSGEDVLVDIGCGRGGPGLWVTARTGARYIGVDIAESALEAVRQRAGRLGLTGIRR
jgi:predicted RNA methylase